MSTGQRTRLLLPAAVLAVVAAVSGCGGQGNNVTVSDPGAASSAPSPSTASQATDLTIVVHDETRTTTWTLTCTDGGMDGGTPGGTHPHPEQACAALAKGAKLGLPPVSKGLMCTQLYGGPQTAKITGTYLGRPVSSRLSRANGCEISRWNALEGLLPAGPPGPQ